MNNSADRNSTGRYRQAIVTGASSGIGAAFAERLASEGCHLTLVARRRERLEGQACDLRRRHGVEVEVLPADLTSSAVLESVERHVQELPDLDLLINCAGFGTAAEFVRIDPARIEEEIRLNVVALARLTRAALPAMIARKRGAILNVSSMASFQPNPYLAVYGATKAFVTSFTEAISDELRGTGVAVQALCPGPVKTEFGSVAGVEEGQVPSYLYVDTADVVHSALDALARGVDVCVPGTIPSALASLSGILPHWLVRRTSYEIARRVLGGSGRH